MWESIWGRNSVRRGDACLCSMPQQITCEHQEIVCQVAPCTQTSSSCQHLRRAAAPLGRREDATYALAPWVRRKRRRGMAAARASASSWLRMSLLFHAFHRDRTSVVSRLRWASTIKNQQ